MYLLCPLAAAIVYTDYTDWCFMARSMIITRMSLRRLVFLSLILSAVAISAAAQHPLESSIATAVEAEDWQKARTEITRLRTTEPERFRDKNYEYLVGRIAERTGDLASATASYQTIASSGSRLAQYALWRLAKIARTTGDLVLERQRLQQLVATAPASILFEAATLRLSESFLESKDFPAAANSAKPLLLSKNPATARKGMALTGSAYLQSGKTAEARDVFTKLIMQMPDASRPDDFALEAVRQLDQLDKGPAPNLSEADLLLRASIYQFNRDFAGARVYYQTARRSVSTKHNGAKCDVSNRPRPLSGKQVRRSGQTFSEGL